MNILKKSQVSMKQVRRNPGRPREKINQVPRGLVKEPQQGGDFEESNDNEFILIEAIFQFPLHIKCISNTIRQIDRNSKLEFCFTNDNPAIQNKCFLRINCQNILSYYFTPQQDFIKFDIPINHIANTFNFYNRSSIKSELRVFGPSKPVLRIDSYKSEKKKLQKITNTINLRLQPNNEDINEVEKFLNEYDFQSFGIKNTNKATDTQQTLHDPKQKTKKADFQQLRQMVDNYQGNSLTQDLPVQEKKQTPNLDFSTIQSLDRVQKLGLVIKNPKLFNDCFFVRYKHNKIYSFTLFNQDIRKFITEVQKDCQQIQIVRELYINSGEELVSRKDLKQNVTKQPMSGDGYLQNIYEEIKTSESESIYNQTEFGNSVCCQDVKRKSSKSKQDILKLKQIILKAVIPGSGSQKKLEYQASSLQSYKTYKQCEDEPELTYNISSNILKQISSNNPNGVVTFIMLDNHSVVLKIQDQSSLFKFQLASEQ